MCYGTAAFDKSTFQRAILHPISQKCDMACHAESLEAMF